jgi:hypothetical protein
MLGGKWELEGRKSASKYNEMAPIIINKFICGRKIETKLVVNFTRCCRILNYIIFISILL